MNLSEFKNHLSNTREINFIQPNGVFVPKHFHITEAGLVTKHFIDCGGTIRMEKAVTFQLWVADDVEHRLEPQKLLKIIEIAEPLFGNSELEVEVEFQMETIGRFGLSFSGDSFILEPKQTDCLAKDKCGIPAEKPRVKLADVAANNNACTPGGGCC